MTSLRKASKDNLAGIFIVLMGLAGAMVIVYATRWGAIVYSDATEYILSARSLLAGKGLGIPGPGGAFLPLTLHPPLFPLVLSGLGLLGLEPLEGARWLNVLLFGIVVILVSGTIYQFTRQFILSVMLGFVIMMSPLFLEIFSSALAEPLFFVLGLLGFFLLVEYVGSPHYRLLIGASIAIGLACLARYTGFVLIISGTLFLLVFQRVTWRKNLVHLGIFGGISTGMVVAWMLPLYLRSQRFAARSLQPVDDLSTALREARVALIDLGWSWIPFSQLFEPRPSYFIRGWFMIILLVVLVALLAFLVWKRIRIQGKKFQETGLLRLLAIFGIFSVSYLAFITFTSFFVSPRNDLNGRLLSPVYLSLLIFVFLILTWALGGGRAGRWLVWLPTLGLALMVAGGFDKGIEFIRTNHREGAGYTSAAWTNSPTIRAVKELDPVIALISNESAAILFLTGRPTYDISVLSNATSSENDSRYGDDAGDPAQRLFRTDQAVLVIFPNSFYWQLFPIYGDRTQDRLDSLLDGLRVEQNLADGVIYRYSQP